MPRPTLEMNQLLADPFGLLSRLRAQGPLADMPEAGIVAILGYEDARSLLGDRRLHANFVDFLTTFGVSSGTFYEWMASSPLNREGAEHQRWRGLMMRTFTPRSVERLRPFLKQAAHTLIEAFAASGACEFVHDFADVFPSLGLCELIGVPAADRGRFAVWANTIGLGFSPMVAMHIAKVDAALAELLAYASELAAARRAEPRDDLISRIAAAAAEDGWTDDEVRGAIAGLVFAGHDTTKNQLGWMVFALSERPDLWDAVGRGTLAPAPMVEELLRYRSSASGIGRTASEPVEVSGCPFAAGQQMLISVWSANHDERVFPRAQTLDPAQSLETPHLAFGHGAHYCLGNALARAELEEALAALSARIECPAVSEGATWRPPVGLNGPTCLPLTFKPRQS